MSSTFPLVLCLLLVGLKLVSFCLVQSIGVRDHFRWGGGGHNIFSPNFLSLPENRICFGNAFLSNMGGGGGGENATL